MPPLERKFRDYLFHFFTISVLVSTLISLFIFFGWSKVEVHDIRDISPFISHIRLALLVCVAMVIALDDFKNNRRWMNLLFIGWFFAFLILTSCRFCCPAQSEDLIWDLSYDQTQKEKEIKVCGTEKSWTNALLMREFSVALSIINKDSVLILSMVCLFLKKSSFDKFVVKHFKS
jgi:cell division protein FtsW (lipid II flippase)